MREIIGYIKEFEYAANIKFIAINGNPADQEANTNINNLTCPAPTKQSNGNDYYDGDIRVIIPSIYGYNTLQPVPGVGCTIYAPDSSWSNPPWELNWTDRRACLFNLRLGDDGNPTPYLNHTLHEFGHALGLAHEHQRADVNAGCTEPDYGGGISSGLITPYDRDSVMHYKFDSCGINGNYDFTGLSSWDRLALHIMYPENNRIAEFIGKTVIRAGDNLFLQSAWLARGANINFVAKDFQWRLNNFLLSTGPTLNITLSTPGTYNLSFSYSDFLGLTYSYIGIVRVLSPAEYAEYVATLVSMHASLHLIDNTPPAGSVIINGNKRWTKTADVTLTLSCTDSGTGCAMMQLSNDGVYDTEPWESFATSRGWTLTAGDGNKKVYVRYKDDVGNISAKFSDGIILDTTRPVISVLSDSPDPFNPSLGQVSTVNFMVSDNLSGTCNVRMNIYNSGRILVRSIIKTGVSCPAVGAAGSITWDGKNGSSVIVPAGIYTYKLQAQDKALNWSLISKGTTTVE